MSPPAPCLARAIGSFRPSCPATASTTEFVDGTDLAAMATGACRNATATMVLLESPSNPMLDIIDRARLCAPWRMPAGALVIVDNVFATPSAAAAAAAMAADIVVYSCTKHIDGPRPGARRRGAWEIATGLKTRCNPSSRNTGPSLSPFNAWLLLKGLETLALAGRSRNAPALASMADVPRRDIRMSAACSIQSRPDHPQYASRHVAQMSDGGTVVTFELGRRQRLRPSRLLNALRLISISNNLGDSKSLATHPANHHPHAHRR